MGNCRSHLFSPAEKAKVLIYNEGEKGFRASTLVNEVHCGPYHGYEFVHYSLPQSLLPPNTEPGPGEVGYLLPHLLQPHHHLISLKIIKIESCQGRSTKILVSRLQLEFLLRDAKMFQSMKIVIGPSGTFKRGDRKWRPSLSAIPEVPDF
ncbi:hypothetical protein CRYUN_Cryun32bG0012000 [Craigia yunnanensis]